MSLGRVVVPLGVVVAAGDGLVDSVRHYFDNIELNVTEQVDNDLGRLFSRNLLASSRLRA